MIESELGLIPDNWKIDFVSSIALFKNGKSSPKRSDDYNIPVYGANGIIGYVDEFNSNKNSIIIGRVGSYCGSLFFCHRSCWVTDNAIICYSINPNYSYYLFFLLQNARLHDLRGGSGQPLLNQTTLTQVCQNCKKIKKIGNF